MIALRHNTALQSGDLVRDGQNLIPDQTLETAVYLSLFTRRLAQPDDQLPDPNSSDRQGFWGDEFSPVANRRWGSRLWLLARSKISLDSPEVLNKAKTYVLEALQWLVEDGIAATVVCTTSFQALGDNISGLAIQVTITKPGNLNPWSQLWTANLALL